MLLEYDFKVNIHNFLSEQGLFCLAVPGEEQCITVGLQVNILHK